MGLGTVIKKGKWGQPWGWVDELWSKPGTGIARCL